MRRIQGQKRFINWWVMWWRVCVGVRSPLLVLCGAWRWRRQITSKRFDDFIFRFFLFSSKMHFSLSFIWNLFCFFFLFHFTELAWADSTIRCEIRKPMNWNATSDRYVHKQLNWTDQHSPVSHLNICKTRKIMVCCSLPLADVVRRIAIR